MTKISIDWYYFERLKVFEKNMYLHLYLHCTVYNEPLKYIRNPAFFFIAQEFSTFVTPVRPRVILSTDKLINNQT